MRTALRTLAFLPPSWGRLSRPLSDISLIWSTQEPRPRGTGTSHRASPVPPQLAPRARPPSALPRPATPSAVLPPSLPPRDGKGEGGTTVGTVGTVTVPPRPLRFLLHLLTRLFLALLLLPLDRAVTGQPPMLRQRQRVLAPGVRPSCSPQSQLSPATLLSGCCSLPVFLSLFLHARLSFLTVCPFFCLCLSQSLEAGGETELVSDPQL